MKKIIITIFIVLGFTSCEKFLKETPKDQISSSQYFKTKADAEATVNILYYNGVPTFYNDAGFEGTSMMMSGYMSGLFDNGRKERPGPIEAQHLTLDPVNVNAYMHKWWQSCYQAISRSNIAIKYIPEIGALSESDANKLLAEARFFRALNYFYLVKIFGDVPLITEPSENLDNIYVKRDPDEKVYDQITTDLNWALDNGGLADVLFSSNGNRITQGVVSALLADAYLQMAGYPVQAEGSYAKAAEVARMIINSGKYELIKNGNTPTESAYNKMRTSQNQSEYIYFLECNADLRTNNLTKYTIPTNAAPPGTKTGDFPWNGYRPLDEYVSIYDPDKDLRMKNNQLFYNKIEKNSIVYEFNEWAPYLWYDETAIYSTGRGSMNIGMYRYAEVLLIAAEAIVQTKGVNNEAVTYLADVRSRGYWQTDRNQIELELAGLSDEQFIKEVWKERYRELALDYKTWPDIQRTRKYPVVSSPGVVEFVDVIGHTNPWGATFKESNMLFPISEMDIQRNPALVPNPGY